MIKRVLGLIIFLFILLLGVTFTIKNPDWVDVQYYFGLQLHLPISVLLLITLSIGFLVGASFGGKYLFSNYRKRQVLNKEIKLLQQELRNLRTLPLKDKV